MAEADSRSVGMGVLFYPRGGSAQVVRYLSDALGRLDWAVELASGSLGVPGDESHAATFYSRPELAVADFTEAAAWFDRGDDPMAAPVPFHPSYEDRPDVPDRSFDQVSPELAAHQVDAWSAVFAGAGRWTDAAVHHLHQRTPLHLALAERAGDRPLVTHLHGTELKFLDAVRQGTAEGRWGAWWRERLTAAARRSDLVVCISATEAVLASELLEIDPRRVAIIPNGVDVDVFDRQSLTAADELGHWRRWLVDDPRGWDESGEVGSIAYTQADLAPFVADDGHSRTPVILFVGRFLGFKRVPLLIRAYARARPHLRTDAPLVIWGGAPGEWEGEHPYRVAVEEGVDDSVFFVGWRGHDELPLGLACSDVMAAPSTDEPFGQVFLEAMSAGLPVVATASGGPLDFVNTQTKALNGWLVPPDDIQTLSAALVLAVNDATIRRRRGNNAYEQIRSRYSWSSVAETFVELYEDVLAGR